MGEGGIVRPAEGAEAVEFDHGAANEAIAELSAMADILSQQVATRRGPRDRVVVDWRGRLRDEFDRAWEALQAGLTARATALRLRVGLVQSAVDEANTAQRRLNREAEEREAEERGDDATSPRPV